MNQRGSTTLAKSRFPSRLPRLPSLMGLLVLGLLIASAGTLRAQGSVPPAALDRPGSGEPPSWVSLALAEKEGSTDNGARALFAPDTRSIMGRLFDSPPVHGCYELGPDILERVGVPAPPRTLEKAARQKPILLVGKVLALTPGFNIGTLGNLVRVEAEPDSRGILPGTEVLFFVPIGEATFHGKRLCKSDPRFSGLPNVGDEVLVFADRIASMRMLHPPHQQPQNLALQDLQGETATYLAIYPDDLIILPAGPDAAVQYPRSWQEQENASEALPQSPAEVLAAVPTLPPAENGGRP